MRFVPARRLGLRFANRFGGLGAEHYVTGHHTAGPKDRSDRHAAQLVRQYHRDHASKGWGGVGYHYCLTRKGSIFGLRPTYLKGTHVGGHNSNNIGVMCHGTTGDRPTRAQRRALRWLLRYAHTSRVPRAHRTDRPLQRVSIYGHNDWSGHEWNACPGTHKAMFKSRGRPR